MRFAAGTTRMDGRFASAGIIAVISLSNVIKVGFGERSKHLELLVLSRILFRLVQVESSVVGSGSFVGSESLLIYAPKIFNYEYC